ncbi:RNA-binding domain-containing protein [Candidatus Marithrix sp. Canyon 246]|uniref:RNA-binding domain-containing protein n=1 Tax=Candidatus Marithrix sp. Canyon 246 TaxID=1827136 RepID=UPI00084A2953|nr:RNA-binding domain-containing protein [Candidatus Marithrix sp. Canyon 246]
MKTTELIQKINQGEDSFTQFKEKITRSESLSAELVAFSNASGGNIILGVCDNGKITGLNDIEINSLNQLISNVASQNIHPPIYPITEIKIVDQKKLVIITVQEGMNKPYSTSSGFYYTKVGADKRKISREELKRLFASSRNLFADEEVIRQSSLKNLNVYLFFSFFERKYKQDFENSHLELTQILENLNLMQEACLSLAGNLLFGINPQKFTPMFKIQCVNIDDTDISSNRFISKDTIEGPFSELYRQTMNFITSNLKRVQDSDNFNTLGRLEIPEQCLMELIVNALVHRDYYINATIKVIILKDRVEIISPGKLPNSLTIEKIKHGISIARNPILHSLAQYILPYSGLGSGIKRILKYCPSIEFINDVDKEEFRAIMNR